MGLASKIDIFARLNPRDRPDIRCRKLRFALPGALGLVGPAKRLRRHMPPGGPEFLRLFGRCARRFRGVVPGPQIQSSVFSACRPRLVDRWWVQSRSRPAYFACASRFPLRCKRDASGLTIRTYERGRPAIRRLVSLATLFTKSHSQSADKGSAVNVTTIKTNNRAK